VLGGGRPVGWREFVQLGDGVLGHAAGRWPAPWSKGALGPSPLLRAIISKDAAGGALPAGCIPPLPRSTAMRLAGSMVTEMPFWVFPGNRCWTAFRRGSIRLCGDAAVLQKHGAPEAGRGVPPDRQSN
jgi:hypothetical protein